MALSLIWRITRRKRLAIWLSALPFAAYHLTPLSGMYRAFWQFPLSQLVASTLIGLVWGYAYVKRGYETAVLAHTLSDWLPPGAIQRGVTVGERHPALPQMWYATAPDVAKDHPRGGPFL